MPGPEGAGINITPTPHGFAMLVMDTDGCLSIHEQVPADEVVQRTLVILQEWT